MQIIRQIAFLKTCVKSLCILVLILIVSTRHGVGQSLLTMEQVAQKVVAKHPAVLSSGYLIQRAIELKKTSFNPGPLEVEYEKENTAPKATYNVKQAFRLPSVYTSQAKLNRQQVRVAAENKALTISTLAQDIMLQYIEAQYLKALMTEYQDQDSLYSVFASASRRQFDAGQIDYLQKVFAETKAAEVHNVFIKSKAEFASAVRQLNALVGDQEFSVTELQPLAVDADTSSIKNPTVKLFREAAEFEKRRVQVEKGRSLPEFFVGIKSSDLNQTTPASFQAGIAIPIWTRQNKGAIEAVRNEAEAARFDLQSRELNAKLHIQEIWGQIIADKSLLDYYQTSGLIQAEKIIHTSQRLFKSGQSDYVSFIRDLSDAFALRVRRIEALRDFNVKVINLEYLTGKL